MEKISAPVVEYLLAGCKYRLTAGGVPLLREENESYRQFLAPPASTPFVNQIVVDISVVERPTASGRTIFESDASWTISADGSWRFLVFKKSGDSFPLYVVRFRPGSPEVFISLSPQFVESLRGTRVLSTPFRYPLDQILTMYLLGASGRILHGAGIVAASRAVALAGVSGAGKSTICRLASARKDLLLLSDDRVIARLNASGADLYGTPWPGEAGYAENRHAPLAGILFIEQATENAIRPLGRRDALGRLVRIASIPWFDEEYLGPALESCENLLERLPVAVFSFKPDTGAIAVLEQFAAGDNFGC